MKAALPSAEKYVWRDCQPGELVELASRQRQRIGRREVLRGLTAAAAGSIAVGIAGVLGLQWFDQNTPPGGIACDEVTPLLPAYLARQLDAERTAQVQRHLAVCQHCTATLKKLQPG